MDSAEIEAHLSRLSDLLAARNVVGEIDPHNRIQAKTRFAIEEICQGMDRQ
jgi:hypothetical protein